MTHYMMIWCD